MSRRQKRSKRPLLLAGLLAALAWLFGFCGQGWFFGDGGDGDGEAPQRTTRVAAIDAGQVTDAAADVPRCSVRVDGRGVAVADAVASVAMAVEACQPAGAADLVVTGDARYGLVEELRTALDSAGVTIYERRPGADEATEASSDAGAAAPTPTTPAPTPTTPEDEADADGVGDGELEPAPAPASDEFQ